MNQSMQLGTWLPRLALLLPVLVSTALGFGSGSGILHAQVAVVVSLESPLTEITLDDLRGMYLGKLTRLETGERVVLLESPRVREAFYHAALRMNPDRVKRHWIGMVFSGAGVIPPREIANAEELRRYVSGRPGAIAFLAADAVGPDVRILRVDGLRPSDADYPIR